MKESCRELLKCHEFNENSLLKACEELISFHLYGHKSIIEILKSVTL